MPKMLIKLHAFSFSFHSLSFHLYSSVSAVSTASISFAFLRSASAVSVGDSWPAGTLPNVAKKAMTKCQISKRSFFDNLPSTVLTSFYYEKLTCLSSNPNHTIAAANIFFPKYEQRKQPAHYITMANKFLFLLSFHTMHTILGIVPSVEILME